VQCGSNRRNADFAVAAVKIRLVAADGIIVMDNIVVV
jgi:hypothetical protein